MIHSESGLSGSNAPSLQSYNLKLVIPAVSNSKAGQAGTHLIVFVTSGPGFRRDDDL